MSEDALTEKDFRVILVEACRFESACVGGVGVKIGVKIARLIG